MIRLHFDSKETALLSTFNSPNASLSPLEVGDIHLYHLEHPEIPLIIIERKTIKDLAASIKDGRYKEQIIRLKSIHQHPTRVFFLIEGCHFQNRYLKRISQLGYDNHLYSAFINIMVRDQISILESDDMADTCRILKKLVEQVEKKYLEIIGQCVVSQHLQTVSGNNFHYSKTIKSNKKQNVNPQVCFISILSQIPGVSTNSAAFIIEKYPTMSNLIETYLKIPESDSVSMSDTVSKSQSKSKSKSKSKNLREKLLQDILIKSDAGKARKLGPVISDRIYKYLFGIHDDNGTSNAGNDDNDNGDNGDNDNGDNDNGIGDNDNGDNGNSNADNCDNNNGDDDNGDNVNI